MREYLHQRDSLSLLFPSGSGGMYGKALTTGRFYSKKGSSMKYPHSGRWEQMEGMKKKHEAVIYNIGQFFIRHRLALLAFLIPVTVMLVIFAYRGIYPFGNRSFLHMDMYHQYMPFFAEFQNKLQNGESLFYSWNVGLGSNFLALFSYYLASPSNWLVALFPKAYLMEFMSYLTIIKMGLCGTACCYYLRRHFKTESGLTVLVSCFYALSGFMAAYNWDIMWLDNVILAPLIILGLERLVNEKKYALYCITLSLSILSDYYISIMICIFLVLYYLVLITNEPRRWKSVVPFAGYSLLAGGLAAVLLIPVFFAMHFTEFSQFQFPSEVSTYFPTLDMLARHFTFVMPEEKLDHWPNIWCGAAVLMTVPLYIKNKAIGAREKITKLVLAGFILVSFSTNLLNFIWHGMNYPDSLPARQSFLYIFLVLTISYEVLHHWKEYTKRDIVQCFVGALAFVVLCEKLVGTEDDLSLLSYFGTAGFLAAYAGIGYWYKTGEEKSSTGSTRLLLGSILAAVMILECGWNMEYTSVSTTSRDKYLDKLEAYETLVERTGKRDEGFYRFEKLERKTKNDGTLAGYPTASVFSSTVNSYVGDFYEKMGMGHSKVFYSFDGATPFTTALLNVKYLFSQEKGEEVNGPYKLVDEEDGIYLYETRYSLPLGYMVSEEYTDVDEEKSNEASPEEEATNEEAEEEGFLTEVLRGEDLNEDITNELEEGLEDSAYTPFERQNRMAAPLTKDKPVFESVSVSSVDGEADAVAEKDGYYYAYLRNRKVKNAVVMIEGESQEYEKMGNGYILPLGWQQSGTRMKVTSEDAGELRLSVYYMNEEVLSEAIGKLSEQTMIVDSRNPVSIKGHIDVKQAGQLILSVPYEPGWTLRIDGEKAEMGWFADAFISAELTEGAHTIELSYYPAGLNIGFAISILCLIIFVICICIRKRGKKSGI